MSRSDGAVCLYRGQPLFCHLDINRPGLTFGGAFARSIPTETGYLFPAMAAWEDTALVVAQGHTLPGAFAVLVKPHQEPLYLGVIGQAINVNPVAVKGEGGGFKVAIVSGPTQVDVLFVSPGGDITPLETRTIPQTSQGITGWDGDELILGDPPHRTIAGRHLSEATYVGDWWIGQDSHGNRIVLVNGVNGFAFTAYDTRVGQRPRFVRLPDGRFAVTASDNGPIELVLEQPAKSDETIGRRPWPDPDPTPDPEPEPDPMTPPKLIDALLKAGREIDRRFPGLRERDLEVWAQKVAYFGWLQDNRIGRKRNPSGAISKNAFGLKVGDSLTAADIVRDNPALPGHPNGIDGKGPNEWRGKPEIHEGVEDEQQWIRPDQVDVGDLPIPDPDPDPDPDPPPDGDVLKAIAALDAKVSRLLTVFRV